MRRQTIETDVGRYDVVFGQLDELKRETGAIEQPEVAEAEAQAIDELRRFSAELAEAPMIFYTST